MSRKRVKLAFIRNISKRKTAYKKRKNSLMKKVSELSTLCGIDACAIIYSLDDSELEVWPNITGVEHMIARFGQIHEFERSKRMVTQETFIRQTIEKVERQIMKKNKNKREKETIELMYECLAGKGVENLELQDLNDLSQLTDQKLMEIFKRMEALKVIDQPEVLKPGSSPTQQLSLTPLAITNRMLPRSVEEQEAHHDAH